jgi:uncharacterized protein (UPF0147 family)
MAIKFNSAFRVSSILRAVASKERGSIMDQWAAVFGVEDGDAALKSIGIARLVGLLREQIDIVESQCVAADYSDTTYSTQIAAARAIATAENLSADWSEFRVRLTADVMHSFLIFADTLPNKETQLSSEEIDAFTKLYKQVMQQIEDGYVPRNVKMFLRHQMKIIANGVREYHVQGVQAFQRASLESAIQAAGRPADVDGFAEAEPVIGVGKLLKKIKEYGSMDMSTEQMLTVGDEVAATVGDPWPGWAWYERVG